MIDTTQPVPIPISGPELGPAYDRLRERGGAVRVQLPDGSEAWLVTGHHQVWRALADPRLALDRRHSRGGWSGFTLPPALDANLLNMDPPDHTRIRRLVASAFTPQRVAALRPRIRRTADELLDTLVGTDSDGPGRHGADLVAGYCAPLSVRVIGHLLGIPRHDQDDFRAWTTTMLATHPPDRQAIGQAVVELHGFIIGLLRAKRQQPGDDLLSALVTIEQDGDRLSRDELTSLAFLMLFAGYENSANLLANAVLGLLQGGTAFGGLTPRRIEDAVEGSLRREPPAPVAIRRFPIEDVIVDGTTIPAGDTVLLCLTSANRDPHAGTAHLAFGHGIHYCVGAALARAEATEGIAVLARRLPSLRLAEPVERLRWRPSFRAHGPAELPVTW